MCTDTEKSSIRIKQKRKMKKNMYSIFEKHIHISRMRSVLGRAKGGRTLIGVMVDFFKLAFKISFFTT